MENNDKLYIPYGLSTEQEYFTGFGGTELRQCIIGIVAFGMLAALLLILTQQIAALIITLIVGAFASVITTRKDTNTRLSVIGQAANLVRFAKTQKKYRYVYKSEWL